MNLILHKVLAEQDLEVWAKLKKEFFEPPYTEIYLLINRFYKKFDKLPTFEELEVVTRDEKNLNYIVALKELNVPEDLDIEIILQALVNEYAQREVLQQLTGYLDNIVYKDVGEMVEDLSAIAIDVEEKTEVSEQIVEMNEFMTIDKDTIFSRVPLGLNNDFDRRSLGMAPGEYIMLGGYRGSGKSIICSNIVCNQYLQGNSSLYFSIEMGAREIYNRNLAILSGVRERHIKSGDLKFEEMEAIAKVRAEMTEDGAFDLLETFRKNKDFEQFEQKLLQRPLKRNNKIITVDNSILTIANIDATIHTYKTKLEDKLRVVIVDYINQITSPDPYNWQVQIDLSKKLKALARKYEVVMVAPFQTSEEGKVRFAKGILDSPNWAFNLSAVHDGETGSLEFECKKSRGEEAINFASEIHWPTLKISPHKNIEFMKSKMVSKRTEAKEPKTSDDLSI
jgi:Demerecviridae putative replicative DNA helicase